MVSASGKSANREPSGSRDSKRRQYLPRPERGGGQVLFRLVLGRTSLSGSGWPLLFFRGRSMGIKKGETVRNKALELISTRARGMRYSELTREVQAALPNFAANTIHGNVWDLDKVFPDQVYKPARGVFRATKFREADGATEREATSPSVISPEPAHKEEDFYEPFADWIVNELEECTKAIPLGGNRFKDKWGTPDVVGIREPKKSDIFKPATEIISAEIKIDKAGLITAFGQACAYKLFAHRSYIVVPSESQEEDIARLDILCRTLGLGFILMDATNPATPNFGIRVRAARHEPDMFYVNKYMKLVEAELFT
jgi:hypothetical protein